MGKWSILTNMFQRGWFNHQLEKKCVWIFRRSKNLRIHGFFVSIQRGTRQKWPGQVNVRSPLCRGQIDQFFNLPSLRMKGEGVFKAFRKMGFLQKKNRPLVENGGFHFRRMTRPYLLSHDNEPWEDFGIFTLLNLPITFKGSMTFNGGQPKTKRIRDPAGSIAVVLGERSPFKGVGT